MNLVLAASRHLLLLVPVPVPSRGLCQHQHVCSHTVNQPEEAPGLKITRSFEVRAAPLADDTPRTALQTLADLGTATGDTEP